MNPEPMTAAPARSRGCHDQDRPPPSGYYLRFVESKSPSFDGPKSPGLRTATPHATSHSRIMSRCANATPLAVQLYSLRETAASDLPGVLEQVAGAGFLGVEYASPPRPRSR